MELALNLYVVLYSFGEYSLYYTITNCRLFSLYQSLLFNYVILFGLYIYIESQGIIFALIFLLLLAKTLLFGTLLFDHHEEMCY